MQPVKEAADDEEEEKGSDRYNIGVLYLTGIDKEARDQDGYGKAGNAFMEELVKTCIAFTREYGIYSLLGFTYGADLEDSTQKTLYLLAGNIGPEKEIWFSDDEMNQKQVEAFRTFVQSLLKINGLSEEEAADTEQKITEMMKNGWRVLKSGRDVRSSEDL